MTTELKHTTIQTGDARITLLSDGTSYWDGGGTFGLVPRGKWAKLLPPDENNNVPQELRCALIETDGKRVLVDCGVGNKPNDLIAAQYLVDRHHGTLIDQLATISLSPSDIDIVIFTHLHGDHSGWATIRPGKDATHSGAHPLHGLPAIPTFPNARYIVQRIEYDDATHTNERTRNTYFAENFVPLHEQGVLILLDGDTQITRNLRVIHTPGHTAGHQSVIVEQVSTGADVRGTNTPAHSHTRATAPVFLLGDMAPFMIHFERLPWVTAYDVLPLITIESKRRWQQWAIEHNATLVSCHDTRLPIGTLARNDKGLFSVVPIE